MSKKRPVSTYIDICAVVDEHYRQLLENPITAPKFEHIDLPKHLPRIYHFWSFLLNIEPEEHPYKGSAFEPHARLELEHVHFEIWMSCLFNAIDMKHDGEVAALWKEKAKQMGLLFEYKLGLLKE